MDPIEIPREPESALRRSLPWLDRWVDRSDLRLGGGTALAAFWRHRHSTDVDLVCDRDVFDRLQARRAEITAFLSELEAQGRIRAWRSTRRMLAWKTHAGPVSLVASRLREGVSVDSGRRERTSGIALVASTAILYGKILGRAIEGRGVPRRDAYDVACAQILEPEVARSIFLELSPGETEAYWRANARRGDENPGGSILDPRFPELARDPWTASWDIRHKGLSLADWTDSGPRRPEHGRSDGPDLGR